MKDKRKLLLVALILLFIMLIAVWILLSVTKNKSNKPENQKDDRFTKYEWISLLCNHMGTAENSDNIPFFEDVDIENEFFSCIQAAVEWGYINREEKFYGNDTAQGKFIALSAIKSVGEDKILLYLNKKEPLNDDEYLRLAVDSGLIEESEFEEDFTEEKALDVINKLDELYFGVFWPTDIEEYECQDNVIHLEETDILSYDNLFEKIKCEKDLSVGDVILFKNKGLVVARTVVGINYDEYQLTIPKLEEVFITLEQSGVGEVSFQDIVNYYGEENLTIVGKEEAPNQNATTCAEFDDEFKSKGFKIEVKDENEKLKVYVVDNNTGIKYLLPISPKTSGEYESFNASLDVKKIFVGTQVKYSLLSGVEYADVAVDIESDFQAGFSSSEEIDSRIILFETPTPIGNGFVGVDIQIYLVTTLDGKIYIEAEMPFQCAINYEKGKGVRQIKREVQTKEPKFEVDVELETKICVAPILVICNFAPIIDAEINLGVSASAEVKKHSNSQICTDVKISFPVIDISVGDENILYYGSRTILAKLGISAEWEIIKAESAPIQLGFHWETLPNGNKQVVDKCTYKEKEESSDDVEIIEELPSVNTSGLDCILTTKYGKKYMVTCPMFSMRYNNNWQVVKEEIDVDYELIMLKNERGSKITYHDSSQGFPLRYNGGNRLQYVEIQKVADSLFVPGYVQAGDYSSLGKFIVAKIKTYAYEDEYSKGNKVEYEGPVYYAIVPESYIGNRSFWGDGYWEQLSWNYPHPRAVIAEAPNGQFTEEEEIEIIQILSTFTEGGQNIYTTNETETQNIPSIELNKMYTTKGNNVYINECPKFSFNFSDNWTIKKEDRKVDNILKYEKEEIVLENERGVEIRYYQSTWGIGSTGGDYTLFGANATKVAESSFIPNYSQTEAGKTEKFVVAKIKEDSKYDGLSGEQDEEFDGPTFYAVIPESYLGTMTYKGSPGAQEKQLAWEYYSHILIMATAPKGNFLDEEAAEVIQILSSFREEPK